jgi:hypothetical protein
MNVMRDTWEIGPEIKAENDHTSGGKLPVTHPNTDAQVLIEIEKGSSGMDTDV